MKLNQIMDLITVLSEPGGCSAFFKWKPFSITSFHMLRRLKSLGIPFKTIIDGGANIGQFARAAVETFPEASVFSFEPLPDIAETLKRNLSGCSRIQIINSAIGNHNGHITFHRNSYSHVSSVLPLHKNFGNIFSKDKNIGEIEVSIATLDTMFKNKLLEPPILLKLDLEGFELEALRGGLKTLRRTNAVLLETAFEPMYNGQALFRDLEKFLKKQGFRFERPIDLQKDGNGNIYQIDALFLKSNR